MSTEKKIDVTGSKEVLIREGKAREFALPSKIAISNGSLTAPFDFISNKIAGEDVPVMGTETPMTLTELNRIYNPKRAFLLVDSENGSLDLWLNDKDPYGDRITGHLSESEDLVDFHINEEHFFSLNDVIKIIKRNKFLFSDQTAHSDFLTSLMNFNAKIGVTIQNIKSASGNTTDMVQRSIEENKNAPQFKLLAKLYKGYDKVELFVQTCLDASSGSVRFYFESVDLYKLLDEGKELAINAELMKFKEAFDCSIVKIS